MLRWPLMEEAGAEGAGGGGAAAGAETKREGSVLADAAKAAPALAADGKPAPAITPTVDPTTGRPSHVPEKFWDAEKKALKSDDVLTAYAALEKRVGAHGLPPENAEGYELKLPDGVHMDVTDLRAFKDQAFSLGLTKKQYEGVMGAYLKEMGERVPDLISQYVEGKREEAEVSLRQAWGGEYDANLRFALAAFNAFTAENEKGEIDRIGNHPVVLRVLARVGRELSEDPGVRDTGAMIPKDDIESLMNDKDGPYWKADHPQHKAVKAKVERHYQAIGRQRERQQSA